MTNALIWILSLVSTVLLVAFVGAVSFRWQKSWIARIVAFLFFLASLIPIAIAGLLSAEGEERSQFAYTVSWTLSYLVAVTVLLALTRRGWLERTRASRILLGSAAGYLSLTALLIVLDARERERYQGAYEEALAHAQSLVPRVPDDANAAPELRAAFERLVPMDEDDAYDFFHEDPDLDARSPQVRRHLSDNDEALALIRKALRKPGFRVERTPEDYSYELDNSLGFRESGYVLVFEARARAQTGDFPGALESLSVSAELAQRLSQDVGQLSGMVAASMTQVIKDALETILARQGDDIAPFEVPEFPRISFSRCLLADLAGARMAFIGQTVEGYFGEPQSEVSLWSSLFFAAGRIFLPPSRFETVIDATDAIAALADEPYPVAKSRLDALIADRPKDVFLGQLVLPALIKGAAHQRLIAAALGVAAYQAKHRTLPPDLQSLVPEFLDEVPIDPFDGRPLRTVGAPGSLIVYSVGIDAEDDGGREVEVTEGYVYDIAEQGDIAFCFGTAYADRRRVGDEDHE